MGSEVMKPLLIGQAPSRVMLPGDRPFQGTDALARLSRYCGAFRPDLLYDVFDFMNLSDQYPGPAKPGSKWDAKPQLSTGRLEFLFKEILRRDRVVLLGAVARDCFMGKDTEPFHWRNASDSPQVMYCWSPHPGGTSMWWNDSGHRAQGSHWWRDFYQFNQPAMTQIADVDGAS